MEDHVKVPDQVFADVLASGESPTFEVVPCPACGKPTKEHHTPAGSRICSARECRTVIEPAVVRASEKLPP